MTTKDDREPFVTRWSRLKQEAKESPAQEPPEERREVKGPAPELPPVEKLTFDSDYRKFFHPKVGEGVRRAALKKLFSDPHFNVMDGPDVHIENFSTAAPIPAAMLAQLGQAQKILDWAKGGEPERKSAGAGESREGEPDEPPALTEQERTELSPGSGEPVRGAAVPSDGTEKA